MEQHKQKKINLTKIVQILNTNKKKIGISTAAITLLAVIYCIFATPIFTAKVLINPPKLSDASTSISGASSMVGGTAPMFSLGGGGFLIQKPDADIVLTILNTNSVRDMIIKKFNLIKYYKAKNIESARGVLSGRVKFLSDFKSGFITINVDDQDPKLATEIANYYTVSLGQFISNLARVKSSNQVTFFAKHIQQVRDDLTASEASLQQFMQQNGVLAGQQAQVMANILTSLEAELVTAQTQLQAMELYASPNNPEYKRLQAKINSIKSQINKISKHDAAEEIIIPAGLAQTLAQKYVNLTREFILRDHIYKVVIRQYEAAKIDAMSQVNPVTVQVIDPAQVPIYKSRPKRALIIMITVLLGSFISAVYFIIRNRKQIFFEK